MHKNLLTMTDEDYFAHPALSQSTIKKFLNSPFKAINQEDNFSLEVKTYGHALEVAIFIGMEALYQKYYISKYATYCKSMADEALANGEKTPLTQEHFKMLSAVLESLKLNPLAQRLINSPGALQPVILWERDGVLCKAKLDKVIVNDGKIIIVDVKSFTAKNNDISDRSLSYHSKNFDYDIQARFYSEAAMSQLEVDEESVVFVNLFIEKSFNPEIICAVIDDSNLLHAKHKIDYGMSLYKESLKEEYKPVTAQELILRKQNAFTDKKSGFVTLSWLEEGIPENLL